MDSTVIRTRRPSTIARDAFAALSALAVGVALLGLGAPARAATLPPVTPKAGSPAAPRTVQASPRAAAAVVTWLPPLSAGASPITGYTVAATPGLRTCTPVGVARTCTVLGLRPSTAYRFIVRAINGVGPGPAAISATIVVGAPSIPLKLGAALPTHHVAVVSWAPPVFLGLKATYQIRWSPNGGRAWAAWASTGTGRFVVRLGLVAGRWYAVQVRGVNGRGPGVPALLVFKAR